MTTHAFRKAHGLGNDFLILDEGELHGVLPGQLAPAICDRHLGMGADGIVILAPSTAADAGFRIFNSDGSEATLSGNALRCAAAWLLESRGVTPRLTLDTRIGLRTLHFVERRGAEWVLRTEIGVPTFAAAAVPFRPPHPAPEPIVGFPIPVGDETVSACVFSMGNPQCITFVEDWDTLDWMGLGAELERHPWFPDRANIGFVRVRDAANIEARFWERGAGHTLASGTGSCACAVASCLAGKTGHGVTVHLEKGSLRVEWRPDEMVELTGPAEITATGVFRYPQPE